MAWETRGKRRVYYRARRVDGKVQKQYFGHGFPAHLAAKADAAAREAARQERRELQVIEEEMEPAKNLMQELDEAVRLLTAGSLISAGYHQHRGHWRKRRDREDNSETDRD